MSQKEVEKAIADRFCLNCKHSEFNHDETLFCHVLEDDIEEDTNPAPNCEFFTCGEQAP